MKTRFIIACFASVAAMVSMAACQPACGPLEVRADVEVRGPELSLADLLAPASCPALIQAAARMHLGNAPLPGSVRVLEGGEIRTRFQQLARGGVNAIIPSELMRVPDRVTVRQAGARASCAEIDEQILAALHAQSIPSFSGTNAAAQLTAGTIKEADLGCGAEGNIPQGARIELIRTAWDRAHGNWEIYARCARSSDCVPFLVRLSGSASEPGSAQSPQTAPNPAPEQPPLVLPGRRLTLLWDEGGIRLVVPVVALDRAGAGEGVRARVTGSGRVVRAIVVNAGLLRAAS
jgi:hypothetical protein